MTGIRHVDAFWISLIRLFVGVLIEWSITMPHLQLRHLDHRQQILPLDAGVLAHELAAVLEALEDAVLLHAAGALLEEPTPGRGCSHPVVLPPVGLVDLAATLPLESPSRICLEV